ncbi:hypothetical protein N665_0225s0019 [Sinapis alba]|nr:hypothetical protein N665_0225s0019 [Sinapis alba]
MRLKEKMKKRKTDYEKTTQTIPTDLIIEILSRLPEKSVARFSCVSKLWLSITTDPSFPRPHLLLCFQKDDDLFVSSIPHHTQNSNRSYSSSLSFDLHHTMKPQLNFDHYNTSTESVHGLICFVSKEPTVWNPSTRQFLTLPTIPRPCKDWNKVKLFLGYDPVERKHKVVCIPRKRICYVFRVFTLGSAQESWRTVKTNHKHRSNGDTVGRCIQGVIYYIASACQSGEYVVMSFDVRYEKFNMIKRPSGFRGDLLITYKGRLACFKDYDDHRRFWILEDAQKRTWSSQDFLSPFGDCNLSKDTDLNLRGSTHAGELIYVPDDFSLSFYILLCDPVKNSWRRFEFKVSSEEISVHNGVEGEGEDDDDDEHRPNYGLHYFPNHIDSQMSL